jgi:prevent-host-death family protein
MNVPTFEAKNRLSELLAQVARGVEVTITKRGVPVAKLVSSPRHAPRPIRLEPLPRVRHFLFGQQPRRPRRQRQQILPA